MTSSSHHPRRQLPSTNVIDKKSGMIIGGLEAPAILDKMCLLFIQLRRDHSPHAREAGQLYDSLCHYFNVPMKERLLTK